MSLTILRDETVPDARLPVADLARAMRLPEGWDAETGRPTRLAERLRAALSFVELRCGLALLARTVEMAGPHRTGSGVPLPAGPVEAVQSVSVDGIPVAGEDVAVHIADGRWSLGLPSAPFDGAALSVTVRAGYGEWADLPALLREAVLAVAEALELGEDPLRSGTVARLLGPWRPVGLGGRAFA
ncbi:hypothetical protein [Jannaschia sp. LMIT008]|uniref:hypothetical protein n=1 Tax=Jannaschia maritima TaxID=3032585 RepID=UPI002810BF1C|nr:hypothetical protein [Jannaschia sp. LMIT008]